MLRESQQGGRIMAKNYDAIIVGARCAGSPLAMLLARRGYDVLVVDRATFPSDTISTHLVHPLAIAALERWGVLDEVVASGCPAIHTYMFDFGPITLKGSPGTPESPVSYAPRRIVLDKILVDAAANAGAEVREAFTLDELLIEDGRVVGIRGHERDGRPVTERAQVVIGADGRHSKIAEAVDAERYNEKPQLLAAYYTYFSDLPTDGMETYIRDRRGWGTFPTNDGLTLVVGGWPFTEFEANRRDVEANWFKMFEQAPGWMERIKGAKREAKLVGAALPNYFRKPFGQGWALVGDAGYQKDAITAQGILDAFMDVERLAAALDESFGGVRPFDDAMSDYQRARDEHVMPMYEFTTQLATLEPPPAELLEVLGAVHGNRDATDDFVRMNAGTISPAEFFSPENIGRIMSEATIAS
jgi:2-polyprenyl-6-methoxyphenol hydroxylase-like FAD-dependent oxidoreductase